MIILCVVCDTPFSSRDERHIYCCRKCSRRKQDQEQAAIRAAKPRPEPKIDYVPTPEQQKAAEAEIRAGWSRKQWCSHFEGPTQDHYTRDRLLPPLPPDSDERVEL